MDDSIRKERIIEAYRAALRYGPEPFDNETRASHLMVSEMFEFLLAMQHSDVFSERAFHTAGRFGVSTCCVDWMQDIAEEADDLHEFIDALLDGYGEGQEVWYVYETNAGKERGGPYLNREDAIRKVGMFQFESGEEHHVVKRYEEDN